MKKTLTALLILLTLALHGQDSQSYIGPENGNLLVAGGGRLGSEILEKFIDLAGGKEALIVVIPTASGGDSLNLENYKRMWTRVGATNVKVIHTRDKTIANSEDFVRPIREAKAVWFSGGRQWRIVDAYAGTLTEAELNNLLERGGAIGGSSAGATIQGSYLVRGDTKTNTIMMGDHVAGFNYLKNSAIDQHLLARNRQFDLIEVLNSHPDLLGIGLDENTAVVVHKNRMEVLGPSYVAVYDTRLWDMKREGDDKPALPNGGRFFLLRQGDVYDLYLRKVVQWDGMNRGISTDLDIK